MRGFAEHQMIDVVPAGKIHNLARDIVAATRHYLHIEILGQLQMLLQGLLLRR